MSCLSASARGPAALQHYLWLYPEWWVRAACLAAWAVMLEHGLRAEHQAHHSLPFSQEISYWMLMVAAMMLPLLFHQLWETATSSLWKRRHRAIAGFLGGYLTPWLLFGVVVAALRQLGRLHNYAAPAIAFLFAALWLSTDLYRYAVIACHRRGTLAPSGWRADWDCLRYGAAVGGACVRSCWPLMLGCALAGHALPAMAGGLLIGVGPRRWFRVPAYVPALAALALSGYYAALALSGRIH